MNVIVNIRVKQIHPHPDNPRKDLGDLTELSESIKKNGVMQNLTVMPITCLHTEAEEQLPISKIETKNDFHVLIGHRRLAAAKLAGLQEVPCRIVTKISGKEQVGMMLEENMQRNDLTIYEQAQGFQMMLDLGETEDSIAEKTGFSKTTVKRRLNIAKLDQEALKKREQDECFQLSLTDLYELEKLEKPEERDEILRNASNSRELKWRVQNRIAKIKNDETMNSLIEQLVSLGVKKAPKSAGSKMYTPEWKQIQSIWLSREEEINLTAIGKAKGQIYYLVQSSMLHILEKVDVKNKKLTKKEREQQKLNENIEAIKNAVQEMNQRRRRFANDMICGEIAGVKETAENYSFMWSVLRSLRNINMYDLVYEMKRFIGGKDYHSLEEDERMKLEDAVERLRGIDDLLVLMCVKTEFMETVSYNGKYREDNAKILQKVYKFLEDYGWFYEDGELEILDGTSELYVKEVEG